MTRDDLVYHYQNLLTLATIPFLVVLLNEVAERYDFPAPEPRECSVIHDNMPYEHRCTP